MLVVDPVKRITIPEIRQHRWFQTHLPRYLAVAPTDTVEQAKKVCSSAPFGTSRRLLEVIVTNFSYIVADQRGDSSRSG